MMRFLSAASFFAFLLCGPSSAFVVVQNSVSTPTQLHLFGGGGAASGDDKQKAPGFMEQMGMMKKAQEMAMQKRKLDEELSKMEFSGSSEGSTVTIDIKYQPSSNMMDPNPSYIATGVTFTDDFFEGSGPEALAAAVKDALKDGIETTNVAVAEKYQSLQEGLMETLSQLKPQPPQ